MVWTDFHNNQNWNRKFKYNQIYLSSFSDIVFSRQNTPWKNVTNKPQEIISLIGKWQNFFSLAIKLKNPQSIYKQLTWRRPKEFTLSLPEFNH